MTGVEFNVLAQEGSDRIFKINELVEQIRLADNHVQKILGDRQIAYQAVRRLRHKSERGNCCQLMKKDAFAIQDGCPNCRTEFLSIQAKVWLRTTTALKQELAALEAPGKFLLCFFFN